MMRLGMDGVRWDDPRWGAAPERAAAGSGRELVVLNYVLFALGFLTGVTAVAGVLLALWRRGRSVGVVRSHLDWQVRVFAIGALALLASAVSHVVVLGLGAVTFGLGLVFLVVPWAIGAGWAVGTVWAIALGLHRINRGLPIG